MELTPTQARQTLTGLRLAIGSAVWLAPRQTARLFGLDPHENPATPYVARLFGARNVALGAVLLDGDDAEVDRWIGYGIALDAADVLASLGGGIRGYLPKRAAVMTGLTAAAAVALGLVARER